MQKISGYDAWAKQYAATFGITSDSDMQMLAEWERVFVGNAVGSAELYAAMDEVAKNPPRWRTEHFNAIQAAIREARLQAWRREREAERLLEGGDVCPRCEGTDWVVVPHPRFVADGKWLMGPAGGFPTAAVLCNCPLGRALLDIILATNKERKKHHLKVPMQLNDYERQVPTWRDLLEDRKRIDRAAFEARDHAERLDKTYGQVLKRITGFPRLST